MTRRRTLHGPPHLALRGVLPAWSVNPWQNQGDYKRRRLEETGAGGPCWPALALADHRAVGGIDGRAPDLAIAGKHRQPVDQAAGLLAEPRPHEFARHAAARG